MEQSTTTQGFDHEIQFWKQFVKSERFLHNWVFPSQNPEIRANHPDVAKCFDDFAEGWNEDHLIMILDVGSGALPWIKGILGTKGVIVACDPLADEYAKIFDYEKFEQDPPIQAFAESLPFDDNSFDVIHCSNALDHTQNPGQAIQEMERVCRPGGMILVQGFENEAIHENWQGLHQWNIFVDIKKLFISNSLDEFYDIKPRQNLIYANTSTVQTGPHTERNWFVFAYKNEK
jgi:SAM-dependent methyltransferase